MSEWQPIKTVPHDEMVLLGVWAKHKRDINKHIEYYVAKFDVDRNIVEDPLGNDSLPWDDINDYDFWLPIPKMPEVK